MEPPIGSAGLSPATREPLAPTRIQGALTSIWARPLWQHSLALVVLLALGFSAVPDAGVFSHDEGAQALQAEVLAADGAWGRPHPFPEVSQDGRWFPSWSALLDDGEHATLWRKPLYSWLGGRLWALGGSPVFHLFSTVGVAVASVLSALCAREIDTALSRPTLWLVGLGSPLFSDGYLLIGHAVGAAAIAAMTLVLLKHLRDDRLGWGRTLTLAASAAFAVLVRREALVLMAAVALVLFIVAIATRRWRTGAMGFYVVGVTAIAISVDELWTTSISGQTNLNPPAPLGEPSLIDYVARGFTISWLAPTYGTIGGPEILTLLVVMVGAAAVYLHRRGAPEVLQMVLWLLCGAIVLARFVAGMEPAEVIPGLLPAFPILVWALVGLRCRHLRAPSTAFLIGGFVLFAGGVILTQHGDGGGRGWGGRYFAIGLPLATVASVAIGRDLLATMERRVRSIVAAVLVAVAMLSGYQQLMAVRDSHILQARLTRVALDVARSTEPGDGGAPVIITPDPQLARSVWAEFDEARWLMVPYDEIPEALRRLDKVGVRELTVATLDARRVARSIGGLPAAEDLPARGLWWFRVVDLAEE